MLLVDLCSKITSCSVFDEVPVGTVMELFCIKFPIPETGEVNWPSRNTPARPVEFIVQLRTIQ